MNITDAVLAALRAVPTMPTVFDAYVPDDPPLWYVVVYADLGRLSSSSLAGASDLKAAEFQFRYVGTNRTEVEGMCGLVRAVVIDKTFTAGGWSATFDPDDEHVAGSPEADDSIPGRVVVTAFDILTARCHRVPAT